MNWTLSEVKVQGNDALHANYWKTVFLTALMMTLSIGTVYTAFTDSIRELPTAIKDLSANLSKMDQELNLEVVAVMITLAVGMLLLSTIFKIVLNIFVKNPVDIGVKLFLKKSVHEEGSGMIADLAYVFDHDYLNHVKNMFVVHVVNLLFFFLLIIPGFIKEYENRMVPFILSDEAGLNPVEAMKKSREMMKGHKWRAFLLDLSFIPWHILGVLTLGILEVFYVAPYENMADAALYLKLKKLAEEDQSQTA